MLTSAMLVSQLLLLGTAMASALPPRSYPTSSKALYVMSNLEGANNIHALPIGSDGTLSTGKSTPTGGKGNRVVSSMLVDALSSQGAVQISGNSLFAVNAGSNTLSMFAIDEKDPLSLKLVGKPISTLGDFPNSVAVSDKAKGLVCVSNTGTKSGVACFKATAQGLTHTDGQLHALPLTPVQSMPPSGPFNTVSQIFFNVDGTELLATVKGDPTASDNPGYFGSFPIKNGKVSGKLVQSSPKGTLVLFGSVPLAGNKVFTTDASFGAAVLQVDSSGAASTLHTYAIPSNGATCWSVVSSATGLAYTTDDAVNHVASFDPATAAFKSLTLLPNQNGAMTEILAEGEMLYALAHGNATHGAAVVVMQTLGGSGGVKQAQNFFLKEVNDNVEGMAIYSNGS